MNIFNRSLYITLALSILLLGFTPTTSLAEKEKPEADFSTSIYSQYVWRGWAYSKDSLVIQPSMTVSYKGFAANMWGNLDTNQYAANPDDEEINFNETDFTLSYDGSKDKFSYGVGYIYYGLDGVSDSQEIYASASFDTLLSPSLTLYKEITSIKGFYASLGISHAVKLSSELNLDLGASIGYYDDEVNYSELHDGVVSASISFPVGEYLSITPELHYSFGLSSKAQDKLKADNLATINDEEDSFIYGGISMSFAF